MRYPDAIEFLYRLRWFGAKLGLENTRKLAALAGNPQERLRFIHVAGTNGKGSTCAMLESIYRAAGLKVGLFTSPHLVAFGERLQVNRRPISESEVVDEVEAIRALLARGWGAPETHPPGAGSEEHPTFFEAVTVMALRYFEAQGCELVIWETGLGGRLDATNIVTPLASIITNIQFDHQKWLGETLSSIAHEKAGIIKPAVPIITGAEAPEALAVIGDTASRLGSPLTVVPVAAAHQPPLDALRLPLAGEHQKRNAAVALAAVRVLEPRLCVPPRAILEGLSQVHWPGRLQLVVRPSGQRILLDGAHNVGGAEMLAAALRNDFGTRAAEAGPNLPTPRPTLVLGILRDKDWGQMCEILAPLAQRILLVPVHSERTAEPHGLAEVCHRANPAATVAEHSSLAAALADAAEDPFVAIAGSLYLIGEAMELLHLSPATAQDERGLNEWTARGAR